MENIQLEFVTYWDLDLISKKIERNIPLRMPTHAHVSQLKCQEWVFELAMKFEEAQANCRSPVSPGEYFLQGDARTLQYLWRCSCELYHHREMYK